MLNYDPDYLDFELKQYLRDTWEPKGCHSWAKASKQNGGYVILCNGEIVEPEDIVQQLDAYADLKEQVERTAHLQK